MRRSRQACVRLQPLQQPLLPSLLPHEHQVAHGHLVALLEALGVLHTQAQEEELGQPHTREGRKFFLQAYSKEEVNETYVLAPTSSKASLLTQQEALSVPLLHNLVGRVSLQQGEASKGTCQPLAPLHRGLQRLEIGRVTCRLMSTLGRITL